MMIDSAGATGPVIQLSMKFRAPRNKVFQCWTEPALLKKWFFVEDGYENVAADIDLKPLGKYRLGMAKCAAGKSEPTIFTGFFHEILPGEKLSYTWRTEGRPSYWTLVTARFLEDGPGSVVELVHGVFENDEDRALHEAGWMGCVTQLGKLIES
jgi:uncharacterized protein YndB with AHSA1/START domain